eukprot:788492-Prymnesium_polylepis.1
MLGPAHGQAPRPLPHNTASASRPPPSSAMHPGASAASASRPPSPPSAPPCVRRANAPAAP